MPRQARLDAPGTLHHVIIRGIERRRIVDDEEDCWRFVSRLGRLASEHKTAIYAWSLMTNHAHMLIRSGPDGLPTFMRRFLTGFAVAYNRRHRRHGHLFQNRYKSIVCDEDSYFAELVRYIHLNPLRVKLVADLSVLDTFPWCGHAVIMGEITHEWQDREYVLSWFGGKEKEAKGAYRQFVHEGIAQGRRPELVGGGLIRSVGGWSQVFAIRRHKDRLLTDERVLGSGNFVESMLKEAEERLRFQMASNRRRQDVVTFIEQVCKKEGINPKEMGLGSRRGRISKVRSKIAYQLVEDYGIPLAEVARQLGVSTSAISKAVRGAQVQ